MKLPEAVLPKRESGPDGEAVFQGLQGAGRIAKGGWLTPQSPITGEATCRVQMASPNQIDDIVATSQQAFEKWRTVPAPRRGELVRLIGELVRKHQQELAELVCLEAGKIHSEAMGEIQEWVDVCDFAVGLSRQLYGKTIASERFEHALVEQWHPLGPVGVISAFNFPCAVWAWNTMVALVCGDSVVWKPSEQTPLTSLACQKVVELAMQEFGDDAPEGLTIVATGDRELGQAIAQHPGFPLVSATGSVAMGKKVAETVGKRLGRVLLELGGNNGMIVSPTADLSLAERAILFGAVGTCGQRCTSLRRLFVHKSISEQLLSRLQSAYGTLPIGDPRDDATLVGPLVSKAAYEQMASALKTAVDQGGQILCGGDRVTTGMPEGGCYVTPAIVKMPAQTPCMFEETFAPLMYAVEYEDFDQAIAWHNAVPQGLSSAIITQDVREAHRFIGPAGSDCGLAGVNIGTSGAEIGGAFGGEKETGGGRESGSDSWKQYMRRLTCTINYGDQMPLSQGIQFG